MLALANRLPLRRSPVTTGVELLIATDTVAYWKLEENTGTREDSGPNNYDLSAFNSPTSAVGKVNNGNQFVNASSQYLQTPDAANLRFNADRTLCCWVKLDNKDTTQCFLGKFSPTVFEWILSYEPSNDRFRAYIQASSGTSGNISAGTFGSPSTGIWYFLTMRQTGTSLEISVNAGTFDSMTWSGNYGVVYTDMEIGRLAYGGYDLDGMVDEAMMFDYALTQAEIEWLYNSGNGRSLT